MPSAQYHLGLFYDFRDGVPQDFATARQWYEKAAAQGHAGAQNNLGGLYEFGHGVTRDDVLAYMWYSIAAAQSVEDEWRDLAAENRDEIAGSHDFRSDRRREKAGTAVEAERTMSTDRPTRDSMFLEEATVSNMWEIVTSAEGDGGGVGGMSDAQALNRGRRLEDV